MFKNYNIPTFAKVLKLMGRKSKLFVTCIVIFCAVEITGTVLYTIGIKGLITSLTEINTYLFWRSLIFIIIPNIIWWIYTPFSCYICAMCSKKTMRDYKTDLCEHIIRLPLTYHDKKSNGELLSAVSNSMNCLENIYDRNFSMIISSFFGGFVGVIVMAVIDWRFAILVFVLGILSVYVTSYFSKKLEAVGKMLQEKLAENSTDAYELVKAAKTIRLLNLFKYKTDSFKKNTQIEADTKINSGKISAKMNAIIIGISSFSYAAVLAAGALFVYFNLADWGTVIALAGLKYTADMLFFEFGQHMAGMQINIAGVKRLFEITDNPKENINKEKAFVIQNQTVPLILDNVFFAYDENVSVLENFNLNIEPCKLTALVGESGSGKSTVMKLILGLYAPDYGSISFKGNEIVSLDSIRAKTAYVPQEAMLFRGSIYDNISCGNPTATKDDIIKAAMLAGANEFVNNLEHGYDTVIYDDGKSLSGGQKQRIAIARALVKNADILLLDEIASALDRETEESILQTIREISKYKAVLLITHKSDIANSADLLCRI